MARLISGRGQPTPPKPPPEPVIKPVPTPGSTLKFPAGNITTKRSGVGSTKAYGFPWSQVARWEPLFSTWGKEYKVDPMLLALITIVESDSNQFTTGKMTGTRSQVLRDAATGDSIGLSQIKPKYWQGLAPSADPYTPDGNVQMMAAFIAHHLPLVNNSWERMIAEHYHPGSDPGSGTNQVSYVNTLRSLFAEVKPKPIPQPEVREPLEVIFNAKPAPPVYFGWLVEGGVGYPYGVGHGTQRSSQHTGLDIDVPFGTKFYAPLAGKITCVGESGNATWGQGCGFFNDTGNGGTNGAKQGVGNITLLTDAGIKIVFGHSRTCRFKVGDRVKAGDWLGTTGGMLGPHMHLEVAIDGTDKVSATDRRNGAVYWLVNPIPALKAAMGQTPVPTPTPVQPITNIIWEGTNNKHDRNGIVPVAIFYHITDDDNFEGVKSWFQNPNSRASSHFVITPDGGKHQFVGSAQASWANGIIKNPRTDIQWINEAVRQANLGRQNFNNYTINLEFLGQPERRITDKQIASGIEIARYYQAVYTIPKNRGHHCRHADVDSVDRPYCPGPNFPLDLIMKEIGADPLILNP